MMTSHPQKRNLRLLYHVQYSNVNFFGVLRQRKFTFGNSELGNTRDATDKISGIETLPQPIHHIVL